MLTRRRLLLGVSALALHAANSAAAWPVRGQGVTIGTGWNTLPLGAGGLINGFDFAPDGTLICWTDVGNCYRWSGTIDTFANAADKWVALFTASSVSGITATPALLTGAGSIAMGIAYSQPTRFMASYGDFTNVGNKFWVYYTNDSGATWSQSDLTFAGQEASSGFNKMTSQRLVIDPNNADYAYFGMTATSAKSSGCYRTVNGGANWTALSVSGSPVAATTRDPGCCGIIVDTSQGTIVNGAGHTVTKRIVIPIGGVGIYESLDGGDSWTETFVSPFGSALFAPCKAQADYSGVIYLMLSTDGSNARFWRYSGPGGTWANLSGGSTWPYAGSTSFVNGILIVDPRSGHQGEVAVSLNSGIGQGFNSTNANTATVNNIAWNGATSVHVTKSIPSYDVGWQVDLPPQVDGDSAFLSGTEARLTPDGRCLWSGFRGFWYMNTMPVYGPPTNNTIYSVGRGIEETVSEFVCCPPGSPYPVMATQDVGVMRGTFTAYPDAQYVPYTRPAAFHLDYMAADAQHMVCRCTNGGGTIDQINNAFGANAYSLSAGASGSWVPLASQPDGAYNTVFNIDISASVANFATLTVNSITSGTVQLGSAIYDHSGPTYKGAVVGFLTGSGGTGTYTLDTSQGANQTPVTGVDYVAIRNTTGGATVAVDDDHHIAVPGGTGSEVGAVGLFAGVFTPVYTANATGAAAWNYCSGLPVANWWGRGNVVNSGPSRPFAVGYGSDLGTVWAACIRPQITVTNVSDNGSGKCRVTVTACSLDAASGAAATSSMVTGSWRAIVGVLGTTPLSTLANTVQQITVVDANNFDCLNLSFSGAYTSGGTVDGCDIFKSTNSGATWTLVGSVPTGNTSTIPMLFTVPGYPQHLWITSRYTSNTAPYNKVWRSTDGGATWTALAMNGNTPRYFCLGAPQTPGGYPTIYLGTAPGSTPYTIHYSTHGDAADITVLGNLSWTVFGSTGTKFDLPPLDSILGLTGIFGDWNTFKRIYGNTSPQGYVYYNQ
ncbi:MAG: exo-alpha-sialidase [Hyphomicrobiales bacterium]|nr:exo-alpha-sialidase [Hyphomicrobiales bacterium]